MKRSIGTMLVGLGFLSFIFSSVNTRDVPDPSFVIGTFLPGLLFLIFGLVLRREKTPPAAKDPAGSAQQPAERRSEPQSNRFATKADLGVAIGIAIMFMSSGFVRLGPEFLGGAIAGSLAGWALMIWGSVNYMRWKGYSGWFGLFGYLLVPGLMILACFPNRRKRILRNDGSEHIAEREALAAKDERSGYRFLLSLVPLGALFMALNGFLFSSRSNVDSSEWKAVAPAGIGFRALMPGTPRLEKKTEGTPAGNVEVHKYAVEPKGRKDLFMIVSIGFPEEVGSELGGAEKLLEIGRQDFLAACKGQIRSEREMDSNGCHGLELEVLRPKGGIARARIYATKDRIYQVTVSVPEIRLASDDVRKFFDSFELSAEPGTAPDRGGR